jgi:hypothetical protein
MGDGVKRRCGRCGEEKNLASAEIRTTAVHPVAIPTELSRIVNRNRSWHLMLDVEEEEEVLISSFKILLIIYATVYIINSSEFQQEPSVTGY